MRDHIDEQDKTTEIRLLFQHPLYKNKVIIVVEGQSDFKLFRKVLDNESIKLEAVDGKEPLLKAMKVLAGEFPQRILAICDADHDHLTGISESRKQLSIYVTDYHDAEIMMLNSPALESFIHEHSSPDSADKLRKYVLKKAFCAAYPIGLLRWINSEESLCLHFKGVDFNQFISIDVNCFNIDINTETLITELLKKSSNKTEQATEEYLLQKISEYCAKKGCKLQVCSGHDLTKIIAMVYRQEWASLDRNMNAEKVESALRLGFQKPFFENTELFKNISGALGKAGIELEMC